jgi:hypothetical protein
MYQRAEDPREREERAPATPEREERVVEVTVPANQVREKESDSRQDVAIEGRRPTIEPASESNQNVTPIRTRREPEPGAAESAADGRGEVATQSPTHAALFPPGEVERFRTDWQLVQATFVDDPRTAIRQADELVSRTISRLGDVFGEERRKLEPRSEQGGDVSTEDLRLGLQHYRAFFERLLSL